MGQRQNSGSLKRYINKENRKYLIAFLIIWVVQMAAAFYFCTKKQGFHEDEYYTYYATARTNGFYVEDGQWMDRETYRNEFVVLPDQRFQYGLVKLIQSWDVHPPMYYWLFHTVASLVPNVFSKWIGLSVNLILHGINLILLTCLSYLASGQDKKISLLVTCFYGLTPAALSGVVFIRMYEMLTMFVLLCAVLHVRAAQSYGKKLSVGKCLIPMAVVTYAGFLTQYYYFIFLFFLAIAFGVWLLWRDRNLWNCIRYGIAQGSALILAYLTYPSCLGQMFRGQRGAQATENFFDVSNTFERIGFFLSLMNGYVFGRLLWVLTALGVVLVAAAFVIATRWGSKAGSDAGSDDRREKTRHVKKLVTEGKMKHESGGSGTGYRMLVFAVLGYFLTVSKTALLLGGTSVRYQLPVYGIVVLLVFAGIKELYDRASAGFAMHCQETQEKCRYAAAIFAGAGKKYIGITGVAFCVVMLIIGYRTGGVEFLYPEDSEQVAFAEECAAKDIPAVYLYDQGEEWCIWDVANELFAYPAVYFVDGQRGAQGEAFIDDERIRNAEELVVYQSKGSYSGEAPTGIVFGNQRGIDASRHVFSEKYCDVYYFYIDE